MFLIVGLGNLKKEFKNTYHNLGFLFLDYFKKKNNFPKFRPDKNSLSLVSVKKINNQKIILAKPQTLMNNSGEAVKRLLLNYQIDINNLLVVHDDIDIKLGKAKFSQNRGSGGHKGVASIIDSLKTKNFKRLRIGIGKEPKIKAEKIVLKKYSKKEERLIKKAIKEKEKEVKNLIKLR
jgi:PTH1 family peptidyl-tRNA hydrolase